MALGRYEAGLCECGFHKSLTNNKSNHFKFDVTTCAVCGGAERLGRMHAAEDKAYRDRLGDNAPPASPDPADGRHVFVQMLNPAEVEQSRASQPNRLT